MALPSATDALKSHTKKSVFVFLLFIPSTKTRLLLYNQVALIDMDVFRGQRINVDLIVATSEAGWSCELKLLSSSEDLEARIISGEIILNNVARECNQICILIGRKQVVAQLHSLKLGIDVISNVMA